MAALIDMPQTKILVLTNKIQNFEKHLSYLNQHGYKTEICTTLYEGFKKINSFQPDAILLSWDLKNTNVIKAYTFLTQKLNSICLVFVEDDTHRSIASLLRSRIQLTLFPPIGGPSIHRRLQSLLPQEKKQKVDDMQDYGVIQIEEGDTFSVIRKNSGSTFHSTARSDQNYNSALSRSVEAALSFYSETAQEDVIRINEVSRLMALMFQSTKFKGYLLMGNATSTLSEKFAIDFAKKLRTLMYREGDLWSSSEIISLEMDSFPFIPWSLQNAEFLITQTINKESTGFAYLPTEKIPEFKAQDQYLKWDTEWLTADTSLLFDLYLHLEKNQKYLLYLKEGAEVAPSTLRKFEEFEVSNIFVKPSQKNDALAYCLKNIIDGF